MAHTPKVWKDAPDTSTPLTAAALIDLETRLGAYADSVGGGGGGGGGGWSAGQMQFDPLSYGCAGDGTTDDKAAMQSCLDAAKAVNGRVNIYKPHKIDNSSGGLVVDKSIAIAGVSAAPKTGTIGYLPVGRLIGTSNAQDVLQINGAYGGVDNGTHILDLGVDCVSDGKNHTAGAGIRLTNCISAFVERCTVFNAYDGILVDGSGGSWANRIRDCEVALVRHSGIRADKPRSTYNGDFMVSGCQITNAANPAGDYGRGAGLDISGAAGAFFHDCDLPGWLNGVWLSASEFTFFSQVACDTCVRPWFIDGTRAPSGTGGSAGNRQVLMTNCYALGGGYSGVDAYALYGVPAYKVHIGGQSQGVVWEGGHVNWITNAYPFSGGSAGFYIDGPTTTSNPYTGPTEVKIHGCNNQHGTTAFQLGAYASRVSITDNVGGGNVVFGGNHKNIRVENNDGYTVTGDNSTYPGSRITGNLDWTA